MIRSKNVIIVCHKNLTQPDDDLEIYLNSEKIDNFVHIRHSFSSTKDRKSYYTWFKKGQLYREYSSLDYRVLPEPLIYLKELFFTLIWTLQSRLYYDRYIGMDGMCVLFGEVLKKLRCVKQTTYFVMDFVPYGRFKSKLKEKIYHYINKWAYLLSDEIWDDWGGERISLRNKIYGISTAQDKIHRVVPYGVWTEKIKKYSFDDSEKHTIVFMGHLIEKQGVQFVIEAIPLIIKEIPDFCFKIIGGGHYEDELLALTKKTGVAKYCKFLGRLEEYAVLLDEIAKSALAIAPYVEKKDNFSYYGDNGKVKTYLGCGLPVLLTNVSWIAPEIEKHGCGTIISTDPVSIAQAITSCLLSSPIHNIKRRENAALLALNFDNNTIFNSLHL